ncbi:MAG: host attachment protein [Methylocella sp.]
MVKHLKLWIVVADGEHARIVAPREDGVLQTHDRIDSQSAHLRSSDLGADQPGRVHESAAVARHGAEPRTDPHEAAKERFARDLGAWLLQSSRQDAFDELVLVAPSHILADLRESLDKPASDKLRGALAKDLTKVPDDELQPHLSEWVHPPHRVQ